MSHLANLKQALAEPSDTCVGFGGAWVGGVCQKRPPSTPFLQPEEEISLLNQFLPNKSPHTSRATDQQTRVGQAPSKPTKGQIDEPERWRYRLHGLSSVDPPCPGFRGHFALEWRHIFDAACRFLERDADLAHQYGWIAMDLFAVHRAVGATRVDCCGALMVGAGALVERVEAEVIHFARDGQPRGRFFRNPPSPEAVLVWDFGRAPETRT